MWWWSRPRASGKTLCYNLPVLDTILRDPSARALYLFPTKALAQDQLTGLHGLITALDHDIKTFTYDGDTPRQARQKIRTAGHIVISNPDMLHTGVLPHHTKWVRLFENLRYIVARRGASLPGRVRQPCGERAAPPAAHLPLLRRRTRNSSAASATIANPLELAERVTGRGGHDR